MAAIVEKTISVGLSPSEALPKIAQALASLGCALAQVDLPPATVWATRGRQRKSWSERIRVTVVAHARGSRVTIVSESVLPVGIFEWTVCAANLAEFERALKYLVWHDFLVQFYSRLHRPARAI